MNKAQQIKSGRYVSGRSKRDMKKLVHRQMRRAAKKDPVNAPRKRKAYIFGWWD